MARKKVPIPPKVPQSQDDFHAHELKIEENLFKSLDVDNRGYLNKHQLLDAFAKVGLNPLHHDLKRTFENLAKFQDNSKIYFEQFITIVRDNLTFIERALTGGFIIPDFQSFTDTITEIYNKVAKRKEGELASYIPQLARVSPDLFGVSLCTIDGQIFSLGDVDTYFSLQSICKTINYCLIHQELGEEGVHKYIGKEPSGRRFNVLRLNKDNKPHNPFINAGAIMACSLMRKDLDEADRFDYVLQTWNTLGGGLKANFNNAIYLSELNTADRNFAMAYFMQEKKAFPENTDLAHVLEFYFQCCSIEVTAQHLAIAGATLANSGYCVLGQQEIFDPETVKNCLSLMHSCGLYDFSGEFAFSVGLPAKSGVSGGLLLVIPNVMGICIYSPRLDEYGNSVRGIAFAKELVKHFNFHNYDSLVRITSKGDPRRKSLELKLAPIMTLIWAAAQGDLVEVQRLIAQGVDLNQPDYDGRTALHLAASEGHLHVVNYLLQRNAMINPVDHWGGTPLSDAKKNKHYEVMDALLQKGAILGGKGKNQPSTGKFHPIFEGYQPLQHVYDEYYLDKTCRKTKVMQEVIPTMENMSIDTLIKLDGEAQTIFKEKGIKFIVYHEEKDDIFPFDLIPRVVSAKEWHHVERGLLQRMEALNAFLNDAYGEQRIFKDKKIPEHLLLSCPSYYPFLRGINPKGQVHAHIAGCDLIRNAKGELVVLEDNLCIPSGVSYLLESREMMKSLIPDWFKNNQVREVNNYAEELLNMLRSFVVDSKSDPLIVVLTPGPYNSAFFEHQYLAKKMACPLVEGHDLFVEHNRVYWKSPKGKKQQVDVIYRRTDDNFIDPQYFRKDSLLGVPGIVDAYRSGEVVLANALGNGVADDKAFYYFVPEMIKYYLGENIILPQVETYLATDKKDLSYILSHTHELVIKQVNASGGYGITIGPQASKSQLDELRSKIKERPRGYVAQPLVEFSTIPTLTEKGLHPHRADLRVFVLSKKNDGWVLPGGLTRVALKQGSYIVNSSQGGGSKDTWVLK